MVACSVLQAGKLEQNSLLSTSEDWNKDQTEQRVKLPEVVLQQVSDEFAHSSADMGQSTFFVRR